MNYLYKGRWISYWYQIKEATLLKEVKLILEIGSGNKIVADVLLKMGYKVKVMDVDSEVEPDFIGDIREPTKSISKESFDLVLCCQVLEHLPYSNFLSVLKNLHRISKKYVILSLPYTSKGTIRCRVYIPFFGKKFMKLFTPFPKKHIFNGQHYWEIGKKGYKLKSILQNIRRSGFKIIKHYSIFENPYHYMIICEKQKAS